MTRSRIPSAAALALLLAPAALSQNTNTTLLQNWRRSGASAYTDVWGYSAPDGKEFAVIGDSGGITILDATDPQKVKSLGFYAIAAYSYAWRDYTGLGRYIYAVSEHHRGIRVFEIQANGTPKDHGFVQTSSIVSAHNIRADPETGTLYVLGGNNRGMAIFDASTNPTNPTFVAVWNTNYIHDACIRRGKAYVCTGNTRLTRILDVRNPKSITQIGQCATSSGYNHAAWVSEDDKILCIAHESGFGGVQPNVEIWDTSSVQKPVYRATFEPAKPSIAHNVFVTGRTAYMSYYIHGFQMVDLVDPTKPTKLANYTTSSSTSVGYRGTWGCYPFQDSGVVYLSDMQNGFYSIRVDCGHLNRFGSGTAGTGGVPRARFDGATPRVGASKLRVELENLEPSRPFWVVLSTKAVSSTFTLLGAKVHVDLPSAQIVGPFGADAKGAASINAPVPNDASLGNARVHMQVFSDRGNGQLTASRGMWAGICK